MGLRGDDADARIIGSSFRGDAGDVLRTKEEDNNNNNSRDSPRRLRCIW